MTKKNIIIVGGGAAGFFCAANLDENLYCVTILEQNSDVLQKVKISGGGRCNVTHACYDPRELVQYYPRGHKELLSVFHKFQPADMMAWLAERGVEVSIEDDGRTFPATNTSQTIIDLLTDEVQRRGFSVRTKQVVLDITPEDGGYTVRTATDTFRGDLVIYAPGSAPKSLKIVRSMGHSIVEPVPSLFTFNIKNETLHDLMGTSFPAAEVSIPSLRAEESGPMLITHWGLSGPAILKISAWKARELAAVNYKFELIVNFLGIAAEEAEQLFVDYRIQNPKKTIGKAKIFEVTNRFWQRILFLAGVDVNKNMSDITGPQLQKIITNLCRNRMNATGKSTYKDEFVTAGGVQRKEINFRTMESVLLPHFYIAGEVIDVDAVTGGFNFQACWSEAWLIAEHLNADAASGLQPQK